MIEKIVLGAGVLRCAVDIVRRARRSIREEAIGKADTKVNEWENTVGISKGTFRRAKEMQSKTEEEW